MVFNILRVILAIWICTATAQAGQWKVLSEINPPFNGECDKKPCGFAVDVVQEILHRLERTESIEIMPWARAYHFLETQPDVFLFCTMRTRQREDQFHWIGPLQAVTWGLYARRDNPKKVRTLNEARAVRSIGTTRRTAEEQYLKSLGFDNIESSNSFEASLRKLIAGRVDLWLHFEPGISELFTDVGASSDLIRREMAVGKRYLYIAISRSTSPETVLKWREAFQDMLEDGTFEKLRCKWFGPLPHLPLRLLTEDAPPSSWMSGGEVTGYSVAVVREILRRLQVTAKIEMMAWSRGYHLLQNTDAGMGLFAMSRFPLREKLFKWVGPLYSQKWGFYARQDADLKLSTLDQAAAVPRIGTYSDDAKELFLRAHGFSNLVQSQNDMTAIRRLMAGQLDLWVSSDFKVPYLLAQAGVAPEKVKQVLNFKTVDDYIGFSSSTPDETITAWQDVLDEMRQDGTLAFLMRRYRQGTEIDQ